MNLIERNLAQTLYESLENSIQSISEEFSYGELIDIDFEDSEEENDVHINSDYDPDFEPDFEPDQYSDKVGSTAISRSKHL